MTKRTTPRRVKAEQWENANGAPWWFIPRTRAAYNSLVEQIVKAIFRADDEPHWNRANLYSYYEKHAVAALRAIGITRPKE